VQDGMGERYRRRGHRPNEEGFTWPRRTAVDLESMARDAFARIDEIHNDSGNEDEAAGMEAGMGEVDG
jgi:hypothetical protein